MEKYRLRVFLRIGKHVPRKRRRLFLKDCKFMPIEVLDYLEFKNPKNDEAIVQSVNEWLKFDTFAFGYSFREYQLGRGNWILIDRNGALGISGGADSGSSEIGPEIGRPDDSGGSMEPGQYKTTSSN